MSGRVNTLTPNKIFDKADMSQALISQTMNMQHLGGFSLEFSWTTSDIVGQFSIEVSNSGNVWSAIPENQMDIQGTLSVDGSSGTGFLNVREHQGYLFRVVWFPLGGSTGELDVVIGGKAL